MYVKLLTEHHLEFLSSKGGCTGSSESTLVKMPHCWKSHVTAHLHWRQESQTGRAIRLIGDGNRSGGIEMVANVNSC